MCDLLSEEGTILVVQIQFYHMIGFLHFDAVQTVETVWTKKLKQKAVSPMISSFLYVDFYNDNFMQAI